MSTDDEDTQGGYEGKCTYVHVSEVVLHAIFKVIFALSNLIDFSVLEILIC